MNNRSVCIVALLAACAAEPSGGRVLMVGPSQPLALPSQAAAVARPGDTIRIAPGAYADCAVWHAGRLTIESPGEALGQATGEGAVFASKTCAGKAIFVIAGSDVTVRNLTFMHAASADHNGAGIRAEGRNLTVERSRFIDNENGILAASVAGSTIRIIDSEFRGNGKCSPQCAHGIYVNAIDRLEITRSHFFEQHVGHHIKSRARQTVLTDDDISDGREGNSSYLVDLPNGGDLIMRGNRLQKGALSENTGTAVSIGAEGMTNPTHELNIHDNRFASDLPTPTVFVRNRTMVPAKLSDNHLQGRITPLIGPGTVTP